MHCVVSKLFLLGEKINGISKVLHLNFLMHTKKKTAETLFLPISTILYNISLNIGEQRGNFVL